MRLSRSLATLACALASLVVLIGCASPTPTAAPISDGACVDLDSAVWGMAWSPGGQYLAVVTYDLEGDADPQSWVLSPDGRLAAETLAIPRLQLNGVTVGPDGRRAWLEGHQNDGGTTLVEDRLFGRRETLLPAPATMIAWTRRGIAIVERRQLGDTVLLRNPDLPGEEPIELYRGGSIHWLWISPEADVLLVTSSGGDGGTRLRLIDADGVHELDAIGADETGASLFGSVVVYHTIGGEMAGVSIDPPVAARSIGPALTRRGLISDAGVLATESWDEPGRICFEDVRAKLG